MRIEGRTALVTGAASGIGRAIAEELARRKVKSLALVDRSEHLGEVVAAINEMESPAEARAFCGDVTNEKFRREVYAQVTQEMGQVSICVPAAGITRDRLATKVDKESGKAAIYSLEDFRLVTEINLIAPVFWALDMVARIGESRWRQGLKAWQPEEGLQGSVIFIGSVSSQGNKGQISYAAAKAGLEGAASTLMKEAMYYGVRCMVIHPGFTDTPMVRAMGEDYIQKNILPFTQLHRLIQPEEIADAVCFMSTNPAVSGEVWADAGWHPSA